MNWSSVPHSSILLYLTIKKGVGLVPVHSTRSVCPSLVFTPENNVETWKRIEAACKSTWLIKKIYQSEDWEVICLLRASAFTWQKRLMAWTCWPWWCQGKKIKLALCYKQVHSTLKDHSSLPLASVSVTSDRENLIHFQFSCADAEFLDFGPICV